MGWFDGRVALVTGAGSGLGRATGLRLAAEGARVACVDVDGDAAATTAQDAVAAGGQASAYPCDVTDEGAVTATVERAVADLGRLDTVCNVAGILRVGHTASFDLADWTQVLAVNLTGTFLVCRAALSYLEVTGGAVVNVASTAAIRGVPFGAAYCASKGGVVALTKAIAIEYAERGVRVNAVAPGGMDTPLVAATRFPDEMTQDMMVRMLAPMGMATPEQVAGAVVFLASDEAAMMTGSVMVVDGGTSI